MSQHAYIKTSGVLFLVVGTLHLLRVLLSWELIVGGVGIPLWISAVAALLLLWLAVSAYRMK
jgi:hypothetical protein